MQQNKEISFCCLNKSNKPFLLALGKVDDCCSENGSFEELKKYYSAEKDWIFGYVGYDVSNGIDRIPSNNPDNKHFPELHFFTPECVIVFQDDKMELQIHPRANASFYKQLFTNKPSAYRHEHPRQVQLQPQITYNEYIFSVQKLLSHIQQGDIYEANFCQEFTAHSKINPFQTYKNLTTATDAPFSAFYRHDHSYILCGSPERFLRKTGGTVISQPIKGTACRGKNITEDKRLADKLLHNEKELAENRMIVDLVRNDLSTHAVDFSVHVDELCGLHSFKTVHQLISTVSAKYDESVHPVDIIKDAFPMGSMTGVPKRKAMELIEKYESFKRGVYSGTIGYFTPQGDFDMNVIIRSICYNAKEGMVSCAAGGAITAGSNPESEYEESILKANAMIKSIVND